MPPNSQEPQEEEKEEAKAPKRDGYI